MKIKLTTMDKRQIEVDLYDIVKYEALIPKGYVLDRGWYVELRDGRKFFVMEDFGYLTTYIWSLGRESGIRSCTEKLRELNKRFENETECNDSRRGS